MSENIEVNEAVELAKAAQAKNVFNLADAIKGRAYPKAEVVIYLDDESAMQILDINKEILMSEDQDFIDAMYKKIEDLSNKIKESAVTFHMRGVGQQIVEEVLEDCNKAYDTGNPKDDPTDNPGWLKDYITILVAKNIEKVVDSNGNVDSTPFDVEKVSELRLNIPQAEWKKLVEAMQKLTLAGGYFEQLTDAGFLPKS